MSIKICEPAKRDKSNNFTKTTGRTRNTAKTRLMANLSKAKNNLRLFEIVVMLNLLKSTFEKLDYIQ